MSKDKNFGANYQEFWWLVNSPLFLYVNGGLSLASDTILAFKSQINGKYGNTTKYLFVYFCPMLEN